MKKIARSGALGLAALLVASLLAAPLGAHEYKAGAIEIVHPWMRAPVPGASVAAGYLAIRNSGTGPDRLLSADSQIARQVEIHEMSVDDAGVMTMRPIPGGIEIPPGATVELRPGSLHLMFMDLKDHPSLGDRVKGVLAFEKAGPVEVEFAVESAPAAEGHQSH